MKTLAWTKERSDKLLPYEPGPNLTFGSPGRKHLSKWIYQLDLERFNILVREPIDVLNFVVEHMIYDSDDAVHGVGEYWFQNAEDLYDWLFDKRHDDCDASAQAVASILHSAGNKDVRLALGFYGDKRAMRSPSHMNHAYCLLQTGESDYKLLDAVGDQPFQWLENADQPNYTTIISAAADGRIWLHNDHAKEWEEKLSNREVF